MTQHPSLAHKLELDHVLIHHEHHVLERVAFLELVVEDLLQLIK